VGTDEPQNLWEGKNPGEGDATSPPLRCVGCPPVLWWLITCEDPRWPPVLITCEDPRWPPVLITCEDPRWPPVLWWLACAGAWGVVVWG